MRLLIIILFTLLPLFGSQSLMIGSLSKSSALTTKDKSEVYALGLNEQGYPKEAVDFTTEALKIYPDNAALLMSQGTAYYKLQDLDNARTSFILVLKVDPNNELASGFIKQIEVQINAKENKYVDQWFDFLKNGGLSFIMIFLGFLGGEIISKKYSRCSLSNQNHIITKYLQKEHLSFLDKYDKKSFYPVFKNRAIFTIKNFFSSRSLISVCMLLEILITFIIAVTFEIVLLFIEFTTTTNLIGNVSLSTITSDAITHHVIILFILCLVFALILRFIMTIREFEEDPKYYTIELAEYLEKLFSEKSYVQFHKEIDTLIASKKFTIDLRDELLVNIYDNEVNEVISELLNTKIN